MRTKITLLVAAFIACIVIPLRVVGADVERPVVIGFAQDTMANDWRLAQAEALRKAFAPYPHIRFVVTDGHGDTARQIRDIEDLANMKVDILIASPRDTVLMTPVLTDVYNSGIPVLLVTRKTQNDAYTSFIAPDDAAIARDAARYLAQTLGGKGRILMLQGVPTATTVITRTRAFEEELRRFPGIKVVATKVGNYLRSDAIRAVEEVVQKGVRFDAIYAQSDSMAAGARIALREAGIDPRSVPTVGIDYIAEARQAIRDGEQSASFVYPTCARETAAAALAILNGKKVPRHIVVQSKLVTRDNVDRVAPIF